ncbi:hypothetical protein C8Q75DRAFT_755086 [Abortiporus biennis]|nr:hypothetical protein C8Q75DRAFT_755086 [Abortiporus biennis]
MSTCITSNTPQIANGASIQKSLDIWYPDGSIVLVAENIGFRVHISILASQCETFSNMQMDSSAQPKEDEEVEKLDECPILRLQDKAEDLKHFLKAIYNFLYFRSNKKTKFPILSAILRLSTKYHSDALRNRALKILSTTYPSTLQAWDGRNKERLLPPFEGEIGLMISLAYETDVRVILPSLYYAAYRAPISKIMVELQQLKLSPSDRDTILRNWIIGCNELRHLELSTTLGFFHPSFKRPKCQSNRCDQKLQTQASNSIQDTASTDSYQRWCGDYWKDIGSSLDLCKECATAVECSVMNAREDIWDQLPTLFGLSDWETLEARDEVEDDDDDDAEPV